MDGYTMIRSKVALAAGAVMFEAGAHSALGGHSLVGLLASLIGLSALVWGWFREKVPA